VIELEEQAETLPAASLAVVRKVVVELSGTETERGLEVARCPPARAVEHRD
jgi:hypothetical protein